MIKKIFFMPVALASVSICSLRGLDHLGDLLNGRRAYYCNGADQNHPVNPVNLVKSSPDNIKPEMKSLSVNRPSVTLPKVATPGDKEECMAPGCLFCFAITCEAARCFFWGC